MLMALRFEPSRFFLKGKMLFIYLKKKINYNFIIFFFWGGVVIYCLYVCLFYQNSSKVEYGVPEVC